MFKTILSVITATFLATAAWGADTTVSNLDKQDVEFAQKAAQCGMLEVRSSEIALQRGLNEEDKNFAQQVIADHKKANKELAGIAERKGITLPRELDAKHQEKLDKLAKASDKEFGERYCEMQISAHKDAIDLFEDQADDGKDADLKAFAIANLPTLKTHLDHAKKLEDKH